MTPQEIGRAHGGGEDEAEGERVYPEAGMSLWRVRASRRVEHWFNADIHCVVHAPDAETAKAIVEADPEMQAWETKPMTPEMAERWEQHKADCEAWVDRNRTGESNRGRKVRGF